jgi:hypothetical protein
VRKDCFGVERFVILRCKWDSVSEEGLTNQMWGVNNEKAALKINLWFNVLKRLQNFLHIPINYHGKYNAREWSNKFKL